MSKGFTPKELANQIRDHLARAQEYAEQLKNYGYTVGFVDQSNNKQVRFFAFKQTEERL